jgi:uncharacterized protein YllA (UPF0747 family)
VTPSAGTSSPLPEANQLYNAYVFDQEPVTHQFWGPIPRTASEAIRYSQVLIQKYLKGQTPLFSEDRLEKLLHAIKDLHSTRGMLTSQIKEQLNTLSKTLAVVEAGHQPALLGGPGFVINKMAAISRLASFKGTVPVMFVGDHDHEQKELTVVHLPSPGQHGLTFSLQVPRAYRNSPLHVIPLPPKNWLEQVCTRIQTTYHELAAAQQKRNREVYAQNVELILNLIRQTFTQASNLADWTLRLWMHITSLGRDNDILFQAFSHPTIRTLMLPAFEYLLAHSNRHRFINAINQAAQQLRSLGYQPGIGHRPDTFVPFFLECPTKGCQRTRLEPVLEEQTNTSPLHLVASCPKCKETHSLEVSDTHPDLSPWQDYLSPRVDTRAFLVQTFTPVILHVGGAGETSYHAQVSPALAALECVVPTFFRYTRLFYGNPWTRRLAERLQKEDLRPLLPVKLWTWQSAVETNGREKNAGVVRSLFAACSEYIRDTYQQLIDAEIRLEQERSTLIDEMRGITNPAPRRQLQTQIGLLTKRRQLIQVYLSQMFGRYSPERFGQEVSFAWVDVAISLGPAQLFAILSAHYRPLTPAAATFYISDETSK